MSQAAGLSLEMREMIIQTLRQVVTRDLPDSRLLELDHDDEFPMDLVRELLSPNVGLHLVFLPEDVGGLGGGAMDIFRVSEEMAAIDMGLATAFLAISLGTDPIIVGGTPAQKSYWLGRIASEGLIVAYGVTEPAAGSNVASLQTVADRILDADGVVTGYRINGTKQFITNGGIASLFTILAKTPDGPTFFAVEAGTEGLSAGKHEDKHGIRSSDTSGVILEDVVVPVENLIGGVEGQGLKQANAVFGYTRLMVGAFGLGAGKAAILKAAKYATERVQFGTTLIEKEGYGTKLLAQPWVELEASRAYMEEIATRLDTGESDLQVEGAVAKYWSTEAGNRAAEAAIQALGGYGYTREYMVEKIKRDVRITTIYEGTSEILQSVIGMYRWKATVKSKGAFYADMAVEMDGIHADHPGVGADLVAMALRDTNAVIQACHRARLTSRQSVMFRLADMMTICEIACALVRKAARWADEVHAGADVEAAISRVQARRTLSLVGAYAGEAMTGHLDPKDTDAVGKAAEFVGGLESTGALGAQAGLLDDLCAITEDIGRNVR